jgi:hypothetical protein
LQKCLIDTEKKFNKATLALLFLTVLTLAIIVTPVAKADDPSITLDPSQGPAGKMVTAYIKGYPELSTVSITFGTTNIGTGTANIAGNAYVIVEVPQVSPGTYTVTATGSTGVATTIFTVTQGPSPTPTATPTGTPTQLSPTNSPVTVGTGFWSPLTIAITSAVVACAIFMTALYIKRGKQKTPQYQETWHYEPQLSSSSKKPNPPSKISHPANNSQLPPYTKICRHCGRIVRDDLNVCPYCLKRLR